MGTTSGTGTLYIVATPIGNLGDFSPRAVETLKQVAIIAAEDSRHSARLLEHCGIDTRLTTYHDHGGPGQGEKLLALLESGASIALISDAGTPLISDPGYRLVAAARQRGIDVTPIPGPCALIAALSASGLPSDRFAFEGFLPARQKARVNALQALASEARTLIFYEAPHRILATLTDCIEVFGGERPAVLARELSKNYETLINADLTELHRQVASDSNQQRGEIVLLIHGYRGPVAETVEIDAQQVLSTLVAELPTKQAAALTAKITGLPRKQLYQRALDLKTTGS